MRQRRLHGRGNLGNIVVVSVEFAQRQSSCLLVKRLSIGRDRGLAAKSRKNGHLPGQASTQGVKGGDLQASRVLQQTPVFLFVAVQHFQAELISDALVRLIGTLISLCGMQQAVHDALAHLRGSFVGECQSNDLFRVIDCLQQGQKSLCQKFSFASTCRGLNNERLLNIQCLLAMAFIPSQPV